MTRKNKVTLPFVVAPRREPIVHRVGTEESGIIEIQRKGYLTVAEKSFMQQASTGDDSVIQLQKLAAQVARKHGIQIAEVVDKLSSGDFGDDIFSGFEDDVAEVTSSLTSFEERRRAIAASCMLYFRVSDKFSSDNVLELHPDLILGLYELYKLEEEKSVEGFDELPKGDSSGKE